MCLGATGASVTLSPPCLYFWCNYHVPDPHSNHHPDYCRLSPPPSVTRTTNQALQHFRRLLQRPMYMISHHLYSSLCFNTVCTRLWSEYYYSTVVSPWQRWGRDRETETEHEVEVCLAIINTTSKNCTTQSGSSNK